MIGLTWFGASEQPEDYFQPLQALEPLVSESEQLLYKNVFDGNPDCDARGDFKRLQFAGLEELVYDEKRFDGVYKSDMELVKKASDGMNSAWGFEFFGE